MKIDQYNKQEKVLAAEFILDQINEEYYRICEDTIPIWVVSDIRSAIVNLEYVPWDMDEDIDEDVKECLLNRLGEFAKNLLYAVANVKVRL